MRQILTENHNGLLRYEIAPEVTAFSPLRDAVLPMRVVQAHQVHGDRVAVVTSAGTTREELEGYDALVTDVPGVAIGARTADCIPVLMYDTVRRVVAAVHSGWKGTVLKIAAKALAVMASKYGTQPKDILAVIGPGIGPDSFQVGPEVAEAFLACHVLTFFHHPAAYRGRRIIHATFIRPCSQLPPGNHRQHRIFTNRQPHNPPYHRPRPAHPRLHVRRPPHRPSPGRPPDPHPGRCPRRLHPHLRHRHLHPSRLLLSPPRRPRLRPYRQHHHAQSLSFLLFSPHDRVEPTGSQYLERYANTRVRAYEGLTVSTDAPHFHNQLFFTALPTQRESFAPSQPTGKHTPLS